MKNVSRILLVLTLAAFVFSLNTPLYSGEKKVEKKVECKLKGLKCSVCGTPIAKDAAKIKVEYKGKTYYFASEKCKAAFEKNPEKYTKCCQVKCCKTGVFYVCPMEKCNYKAHKPGKCPKCGMELKKKAFKCEHKYKAVYVCPVEKCTYKSDKPGKCPKCGKELKKAMFECCTVHMHQHAYKHKCSEKKEAKMKAKAKECPLKKTEKKEQD